MPENIHPSEFYLIYSVFSNGEDTHFHICKDLIPVDVAQQREKEREQVIRERPTNCQTRALSQASRMLLALDYEPLR